MRVAVHHPARTEPDGTAVEASVCAFRLGRIDDFTNPLTGETTPKDQVASLMLDQAKGEHPDCTCDIQVLQDNGDGTSSWVAETEAPAAAGSTVEAAPLTAEQGQVTQ